MKYYHKIFGLGNKGFIDLSCNFSRWIVGFGWVNMTIYESLTIHLNLGPFEIALGWGY